MVVNDVLIDPRNSQRVLLATDRSGVLASDDSAASFSTSNHGYTHRYVSAILADSKEPNTLYIGVVNDREFGGVFFTHDGGQTWQQKSKGLDGRDVFTLKQSSNGTLVAGTNKGVFELAPTYLYWHPINNVVVEKTVSRTVKLKSGKTKTVTSTSSTRSILEGRVSDADLRIETLVCGNFGRTVHQQGPRQDLDGRPHRRSAGFRFGAGAGRPGSRRDALQRAGFSAMQERPGSPPRWLLIPLTFAA